MAGVSTLTLSAESFLDTLGDQLDVSLVAGSVTIAADSDGDGIEDSADNCTLAANGDQRDTDADNIGNVCDQDLNNDCIVNFFDLGVFKSVFFTSDPDADFDGDGAVDFSDLGIMKSAFYALPGPSGLPNDCSS